MKKTITSILFALLFACSNNSGAPPSDKTLNIYTQHSQYTDPGEYGFLFEDLSESFPELCSMIKHQLIHPVELGDLRKTLPVERHFEDGTYPTVKQMLEGLLHYDQRGFTLERQREDRLVVACYHHSLLLASILRYRKIPVRIRAEFAKYYEKDAHVRFGHVICEVWNQNEKRWMLIDPDRQFVDFSRRQFEFSDSAWERMRKGKAKPGKYIASYTIDDQAILHILLFDLSCVLLKETPYWDEPAILQGEYPGIQNIDAEKLEIFDQVARLLSDPDKNFEQLSVLYQKHKFLQSTGRTFEEWMQEKEKQ